MATKKEEELIIFRFRKVETMNPSNPEAKVVAVSGGRIVSVGSSMSEMAPWIRAAERKGMRVVVNEDFATKVAYPGFIEPHIHPLIGGTALSLPTVAFHPTPNPYDENRRDIPGCKTKAEVMRRLKEEEQKLTDAGDSDSDLLVWGWDTIAMYGDEELNRQDLDQVSQSRVVAVWDCSMHNVYSNSAGLEKCGLLADKSSIFDLRSWWTQRAARKVGGIGRTETGDLNGVFLGLDATYFMMPVMRQVFNVKRMLSAMHKICELGRQNGITSMAEMYLGVFHLPLEMRVFDAFFNNASSVQRCAMVVKADRAIKFFGGIFKSTRRAIRALAAWQRENTAKLFYNCGVKFFTDDAFLALTMQMGHPGYVDGHKGIWNTGPGGPGLTYVRNMLPWWRAGFRIHVHSNGDAAQDATLQALGDLQALCPRFDHRFCFEHFGSSSLSLIRRLKALWANASVNPYYIHLRGELNEEHLGTDRSHAVSRLRMLLDQGVTTACHTDTPVAPPRPLEEIWIASSRKSEAGQVFCPAERVTVFEALKMKTVDAAHVIGLDDAIGSVEAGKMGDFTVLDGDILQTEIDSIPKIPIVATILGGRVIPNDASPSSWGQSFDTVPEGFWEGLAWLFHETTKSPWKGWFWRKVLQAIGHKVPSAAQQHPKRD